MSDFRIHLPRQLYTAEQVRAIERCAIEQHHTSGLALMERAGASCFQLIQRHWPQAKSICVMCGSGNNAGDGYVIALLAYQAGMAVEIIQMGNVARLKGDAATTAAKVLQADIAVREIDSEERLLQQKVILKRSDVIVDALLGTGLKGSVRPLFDQAIELVNRLRGEVFAVDIPSGLCADTGAEMGRAVRAQLTNTFIGVKRGLLTGQGPGRTGRVLFDDLGIEQEAYQAVNLAANQSANEVGADVVERIDWPSLGCFLKARDKGSHKGKFGRVLVVGGNYGMAGAVAMAGEAALRVGAGMVSIATRPEHVSIVTASRPEMMVHGIEAAAQLGSLINKATVIVLGPGLGQDKWAQQVFGAIIDCSKPMVIDADALNLLAVNCFDEGAEEAGKRANRWILTPHPGEAGRLMACESSEIGQDRFQAALELRKKYRATVVLKGAGTLVVGAGIGGAGIVGAGIAGAGIAGAEVIGTGGAGAGVVGAEIAGAEINSAQSLRLASVGNPGMASAGMGDVLSGIIGGLLAQGLNDVDAASLGVVLHGAAADRSVAENGERGLLATDLFVHLRRLVNGSMVDN